MKRCVLALDTSNYTTSLGIIDENLGIVANLKRPLPVKEGERGLRQSDAVFSHVKNLPELFREARPYLTELTVSAVGVSSRPRNQEGSYMPCFLVGVSAAEGIRTARDIPLLSFSHQSGHIAAALYGADALPLRTAPFAAFHVSGGTTELVRVTPAEHDFSCEVVGGSRDLHAGQVIDRVGVSLGLSFPAGPALEQLAMQNTEKVPKRKPALSGCYCHLSGLENMARDLYTESGDACLTAAFVFDYIGSALALMARAYRAEYGDDPILFAGGVMSSTLLQARLRNEVGHAYFAPPALSADNAVGTAVLTALEIFR